jgi:hypothetical protein
MAAIQINDLNFSSAEEDSIDISNDENSSIIGGRQKIVYGPNGDIGVEDSETGICYTLWHF